MASNQIQEYQLPTPVDGQQFQLTTINGNAVNNRVQGQNCFLAIMAQWSITALPGTITRTYQWVAMGSTWIDIQSTTNTNFFTVVNFPNAAWGLLTVTPK
jgi:hypothetical protein